MSRGRFTGPGARQVINPSDFAAVANSVSETNLWTPNLWTPTNGLELEPGLLYELIAGGICSTTGTPTLTPNLRYGQSATPASNQALGTGAAITTGTGLAAAPWHLQAFVGVRSIGQAASGAALIGTGLFIVAGTSTAIGGTTTSTSDDTSAQGFIASVTWGAASASNTITCKYVLLRPVN